MHPVLKKIYTLIDEKLLNTGNKKEAIVLSKTIKNLKKPQDVYNSLFDAPKGSVNYNTLMQPMWVLLMVHE